MWNENWCMFWSLSHEVNIFTANISDNLDKYLTSWVRWDALIHFSVKSFKWIISSLYQKLIKNKNAKKRENKKRKKYFTKNIQKCMYIYFFYWTKRNSNSMIKIVKMLFVYFFHCWWWVEYGAASAILPRTTCFSISS